EAYAGRILTHPCLPPTTFTREAGAQHIEDDILKRIFPMLYRVFLSDYTVHHLFASPAKGRTLPYLVFACFRAGFDEFFLQAERSRSDTRQEGTVADRMYKGEDGCNETEKFELLKKLPYIDFFLSRG
uniref:Uncharacterized protein n=1 Tax=Parascaris equorum TaxID=6256 RepID=A0A914RHG9_PAREQ